MNKLVPTIKDRIKYYADRLPVEESNFGFEQHSITGEELLLCDHKRINGERIDKNGQYLIDVPVLHRANHEQRLREVYKKSGKEGVFQYLQKYLDPEHIKALRVEIYESGNFETSKEMMYYRKSMFNIKTSIHEIAKNKVEYSQEFISDAMDRVIVLITNLKDQLILTEEQKAETDKFLNKAYKLIGL